MSAPWLAIIGIGEDGVEAVSPLARSLIGGAGLVVGGRRHLALAAAAVRGQTLAWPRPMADALPAILERRPAAVAVLASGDPFCHGVGSLLARHVPAAEMLCLPAPSAFALACARLGWAAQETGLHSVCGRPVEALLPALQPGARLLVLSADASSPATVTALLAARGFGRSTVHVLEALGGPRARQRTMPADGPMPDDIGPLNLLGIELAADPDATVIPLSTGLPDALFEHDGQITKREVRAATLAALSPRQGELLWDVGCGSGSIAVEWMLRHPANRAIGLEPRPERAARALRNAAALGVPALDVRTLAAPDGLDRLPVPDAVFIGGGAATPGVLEACRASLRPGGRLVANAVTVETEAALFEAHARHGGDLTRLSVERLDAIGRMHGFRPSMTVTQYRAVRR